MDDDATEQQLLFRSTASSGLMQDEELRSVKLSRRKGDRLRVAIHSVEDSAIPGGQALLHVQSATLLSLSLRSNTGFEHTREVTHSTDETNETIPASLETSGVASGEGPEGGGHGGADGGGEARRQERAELFAQWVLQQYPHLILAAARDSRGATSLGSSGCDGHGEGHTRSVLDVAGGRGELSLHLTLLGLPCTLVDPRPTSGFLSKWQRKRLRKSSRDPFRVVHAFFGEEGGEESAALAKSASLIVGMHPDECTEAIVDAAIAAGRPFAVVPCCVFTRLFPHRRLRDGRQVRTREQFCEYLRQKDPGAIRLASLAFKGANTIVYSVTPPVLSTGPGTVTDGDVDDFVACAECEMPGSLSPPEQSAAGDHVNRTMEVGYDTAQAHAYTDLHGAEQSIGAPPPL